ncbi:MAG: c-type cytochrome [Acidobacteria bacterium]|nr:c-type cytochrome [Acidobacteriota bacterium]
MLQMACREDAAESARRLTGGDPETGKTLINRYGCGSCHTIPGIRMAQGKIGPPLDRMRERAYLAGGLPNTPENLTRWIRFPKEVKQDSAMPELGVGSQEAKHIAAYLYTLR